MVLRAIRHAARRRPAFPALGALALGALAVAATGAGPAVAAGATGADGPAATTYYVAVGASESLGVQPAATSPNGAPTDRGYANALVAMERTRWPGLRLVHFGCPGITAEAALNGGGPCSFAAGSEVSAAVDFIRDHRGQTVLVTVDLGFNDLWPCLVHHAVDAPCVTTALARVSRALPVVLQHLRAAGGPSVRLVGLLHNDPYLAAALQGPAGQRFSAAALSAVGRLNATMAGAYRRAGVSVADVPSAFALGTSAPVDSAGTLPRDVARNCALTWMCTRHNIHPNAAGYGVIADTIAAALPSLPAPAQQPTQRTAQQAARQAA